MAQQPKDSQSITLDAFVAGIADVQAARKGEAGIVEALNRLERRLVALEGSLQALSGANEWLDTARAAKYLSLSKSTLEKHRVTAPRLTGSRVGGKVLYKRSDLDQWVKLYDLRSMGRC